MTPLPPPEVAALTASGSRLAAACKTHALTVINAARYGYLEFLAHGLIACAITVRTLLLDDLARAVTIRTCLHILDLAKEGLLGVHDFALAVTLAAGLG